MASQMVVFREARLFPGLIAIILHVIAPKGLEGLHRTAGPTSQQCLARSWIQARNLWQSTAIAVGLLSGCVVHRASLVYGPRGGQVSSAASGPKKEVQPQHSMLCDLRCQVVISWES
ncbi:hypothetical protein NDU88_003263 [Pleurodeles waltl]|uniref:Uncharacterized protein n=1 Tax=Pleurodeles waltl TaxID=8319 RepID=A0AAV7T5M4_PLEWA|nr:hypothetical protein NDU88_003263 [Pleurodeles waltl]